MKEMGVPKGWKKVKLGDLLEEYCAKNNNQKYKAVAVGKYGIRKREDIYSKDLSKDISKNKIIMKDTLTIGMGSTQIDIGILTNDDIFCVSPAYTTYKIKNCNSKFLEYYLEYLNPKLSDLFMIVSARQGKSVDKEGLLNYEIILPPIEEQDKIVKLLKKMDSIINKYEKLLKEKDRFIKSQFVEMFGNIIRNDKKWNLKRWNQVLIIKNGRNQKDVENDSGKYPIYGSGGIIGYANDYICNENTIIIGRKGSINNPCIVYEKFWNVDTAFGIEPLVDKVSLIYLYMFCLLYNFNKLDQASTIPSLTKNDLLNIKIPVPPMELQNKFEKIVRQIDKQKLLLEQQKQNYINLKKGLMQKLLTGKVRVKI